ncbi:MULTISPECIES: HEAT repeat domain-containing protein [unclassified Microcoleus]|uniref:NACHT C-terminal alpha/beta 1 domain-containing protein n=1 Tax=unclassified Microcoleus TaxID=2642155 RepID=UPI0025DFBAAE|nr:MULTISPECIES: HEAT repeat domain-containing protein [unclassified Microcoleus]
MAEKGVHKFGREEHFKQNVLKLVKALLLLASPDFTLDDSELKAAVQVEWISENTLKVSGEYKKKNKRGEQVVPGITKQALWQLAEKTGNPLELPKREWENSPSILEKRKQEVVRGAIYYLEDLGVLQDKHPKNNPNKRPNTPPSRFTLSLKHKNISIDENLDVVRQKLQLEISPQTTDKSIDYWRDICGNRLEKQKQLTTNRLVLAKAMVFNLDDIDVDLELVERIKPDKRSGDDHPEKSRLYQPDYEETEKLEYQEFLVKVIKSNQSNKIAVIGEAGAGKTTLLQRIAFWILENTDYLPIWISLGNLPKPALHLKEYLLNRWLEDTLVSITPEIKANFEKQLIAGKVWLLLDGVDEMAASGDPLTFIDRWLPTWSHNLPVMLTCRLNIWEANPYALNGFQTYRTLWFSEEKVKQFIHDGFRKSDPALGIHLQQELNQTGKERIKDLVRNPLRLMLLCSIWHLLDGKLPDTKAELYQHYVEEVYRWKQDEFRTTPEERQQLNAKLRELAKEAIDKQENRFCLQHKFIEGVFKNDSLFQLALKVCWLNQVGVDAKNPLKPVYAFYHPTFQEYFAACAIGDRDFFLPGQHQDKPVAEKYRIFEPQWKEVILLWLGRENIEAQKQEFIDALVNFDDGCGEWEWENIGKGFYEYRAYFLAASGINEFKSHPLAKNIVNQLVHIGLGYFNQEKQEWQKHIDVISRHVMIDKILAQTDKSSTIQEICSILENPQYPESFYRRAISVLGEIGQGDFQSTSALNRVLNNTKNHEIRNQALISLNKIESAKPSTIDRELKKITTPVHHNPTSNPEEFEIIEDLIKLSLDNDINYKKRINARNKLKKANQQDSQIIKAFVEVIEKDNDPSLRYLALDNLCEIDRRGIVVTRVSMKIIENFKNEDEDVLLKAVRSLKKTDAINDINSIDCLLSILSETNETKDKHLQIALLEAVGKVGHDNPKAIDKLTGILANTKDEEIRFYSADSLGRINPGNCKAVAVIIEILETTKHQYQYSSMLPNILKPCDDFRNSSKALDSLGEIGKGSKNAIYALVKVLETAKAEYARRRAINSLLKIITTDEHRQEVVSLLQPHMKTETYENNFDLFEDCYVVLWHCAQNLSYPDFYQAWHQDTITNSATASPNLEKLPQFLAEAINYRPDLCNKVKLICIDSDKFCNPENPATKIYNEMRLQGCDKSEDGKPKTMAELQDYWDELRIESEIPLFFICYDSTALSATPTGFSEPFLKALSKFDGAICVVCEQGDIPLPTFSPSQPNLIAEIVAWISEMME